MLDETERHWLLLLAYLYLEQRKAVEARVMLRFLSRLAPEDPGILRCLALAELMSREAGAAARSATRAMHMDDSSEYQLPVGLIFARALWEQGQRDAARDFAANLLQELSLKKSNNEEGQATKHV